MSAFSSYRVCVFLAFVLFCCTVASTSSFSSLPPTGRRVLVLLQDESIKDSHSSYFATLQAHGQQLTFKLVEDQNIELQVYGEHLYDSLILFITSFDELSGVNVEAVLRFIDEGHNVILATSSDVTDNVRELASECGVEFDEKGTTLVDHFNFDVSDSNGPHTLLVGDQKLQSEAISGRNTAPILYRGTGMRLKDSNSLVFPIVHAASTSFAVDLSHDGVVSQKSLRSVGKNAVMVAGNQARNNARTVISGSLELFSNALFDAPVQKYSPDGKTTRSEKSGNRDFATTVSLWALKERGVLQVSDASHVKLNIQDKNSTSGGYRINDQVVFSARIHEWNGQAWVPFSSQDVQLEFIRLDPHIRIFLKNTAAGVFSSQFTIPDVYGVFTFKLTHHKIGYSFFDWKETVAVRPYRHDEYERFIPAAYPYYASAFSMMVGFALFTIFFLYHEDPKKKTQN